MTGFLPASGFNPSGRPDTGAEFEWPDRQGSPRAIRQGEDLGLSRQPCAAKTRIAAHGRQGSLCSTAQRVPRGRTIASGGRKHSARWQSGPDLRWIGSAMRRSGSDVQTCSVGLLKNAAFTRGSSFACRHAAVRAGGRFWRQLMAPWAALGRGKMALRKISEIMAASRLRLMAAAVRKAIRIFSSPRRIARARPCQVFASPWKPSDRQRCRR